MAKQLLLASAFMMATLCAFAQNNTTDEGVEINGIVWATRNVDAPGTFAENPEDAGMLFQWNRRVGWSATNPLENSDGGTTWDSSISGGTEWYAENDPCPIGWRVPTMDELRSLNDTDSIWTIQNDVNGLLWGTYPNKIFLPATGWRNGNGIFGVNIHWTFWSSTRFSSLHAISLGNIGITANHKALGLNIRCVKAENETSINTPPAENNRTVVAFYNVLGQRLGQAPQRGIYIVVFDNGTAERRMR